METHAGLRATGSAPIARHITLATCAILAIAVPSRGLAQSNPSIADATVREATILRIDSTSDLVVDTGASGASVGDEYGLYRPVLVRHPVTGRPLRDRFRIGTVRIRSTGTNLSLVRAVGALDRPAEVGDILVPANVAAPPRTPPPAPPRTQPAPSPRASSVPDNPFVTSLSATLAPAPSVVAAGVTLDERVAVLAWLETLERPPAERAHVYERFLREHASSPYAAAVRREIIALNAIDQTLHDAATPEEIAPPEQPTAPEVHADVVSAVREGDPLVFALQLSSVSDVRGAILHVRRHGEPMFNSQPLALDSAGFLRGRVDDEFVEPPGLEYFVEVITTSGQSIPAIGSAQSPVSIAVSEAGEPPERIAGRTRMELSAEFADVGSGANHPEYFTRFEGNFLQRLELGPFYGYRVGFGGYDGVGQPLCAYADAHVMHCANGMPPPLPAHATAVFGFHEFEFAANDFVHFMGRLEVGVIAGGITFGVGTSMRVGRERGTNIVFGGHLFNGVGQKLFFDFMFYPVRSVSMTTEAEVFNQLIDGGDPMFRFVEQVGYRVAPFVRLSVRASYQLRTMTHGGFGGGVNATFDF
jgi:hypothetical protein